MTEPPPLPADLSRLRVIATYLQLELERVHRRIAEAEQRDREAARQATARPLPPPAWTLQMNVSADPRPVAVHHGQCTVGQPRIRPISRRAAIEALTAGVEACALCRPDRELQVD
ncbi:DUF6233 domain-containing protein [Streptomyces sp. MCA2]|uniref:DUF6233 domain-containing protein n=1 Tax=Streptomyces sp. MCA2 TaxID=2944805 RepID=UPI002021DBCF|nr:DUF6233 domain-containing protein [Streptomyces sp. MCA2]MCL7496083.1 DUF6233 domain-containing protein [Streptomyces sp. MCA2]